METVVTTQPGQSVHAENTIMDQPRLSQNNIQGNGETVPYTEVPTTFDPPQNEEEEQQKQQQANRIANDLDIEDIEDICCCVYYAEHNTFCFHRLCLWIAHCCAGIGSCTESCFDDCGDCLQGCCESSNNNEVSGHDEGCCTGYEGCCSGNGEDEGCCSGDGADDGCCSGGGGDVSARDDGCCTGDDGCGSSDDACCTGCFD